MQNFSYENKFDSHENERAGETQFHMKASHEDLFWRRGKRNSEMAYSVGHCSVRQFDNPNKYLLSFFFFVVPIAGLTC